MIEASAPADRADVLRELGELDPLDVEEVLKLGPRVADLVEARIRRVQHDPGDEPLGAPAPVVARILTILRDAAERFEEEDDGPEPVEP